MKNVFDKMFKIGIFLFISSTLLLFLGFCMDDGSIQLDSSFNWIGHLWTIVFLFSVLLILIGSPVKEKK